MSADPREATSHIALIWRYIRLAMVKRNGLVKRLLFILIVSSALITMLITSGDLYLRYHSELRQIEADFAFIADIYLPALEESVWAHEERIIVTQLDGLLRLPNVSYLSIAVEGKTRWTAGKRDATSELVRTMPLRYGPGEKKREIGQLTVVASKDKMVAALWAHLTHTLIVNAIKITLLCLFMLVVFELLVTRHLDRLGRFFKELPGAQGARPLRFLRAERGRWRPDVLDEVAEAVNKMVVSLRDASLRSEALTARLAKSEAMFHTIFSEAGSAITVIDCETLALAEANEGACQTLGYSSAEMLSMHLSDYHVDLAEGYLRELFPLLGERGLRLFSRHRCKDGRLIDVDESLRVVHIDSRALLVQVWRDITEQKNTERQLAQTRDELRLMAESVPVAVYRYKREGDTARFVYISPPIERLMGVSADEVMADRRNFIARVHPEDVADMLTAGKAASAQGKPFRHTFRVVPRPGEVRWMMSVSEPREEIGHGLVWYGYIQDVTEQELSAASMRVAQDRFRVSFEGSPVAVAITRARDGKFIAVNPNFTRVFGWAEDELIGRLSTETVWQKGLVREKWLEDLRTNERIVDRESVFYCKDGRPCPISVSAVLTEIDQEECALIFVTDISERVRARETEMRAASVFATSAEGIMVCDAASRIIEVNPAFTQITGYAREEVIGQPASLLNSGRHSREFYAEMWRSLAQTDAWRGEIWNRRKDGSIYPEMISIAVVTSAMGAREYVAVFSDISRFKAHEEELHRIAYYDALTGLPNRRLLSDRLTLALARARREGTLLAVCFLDLDGFKPINDEHGHAVGDQFLLGISRALSTALRGGDTLARIGGDEFVMLFGDIASEGECRTVLQRVLDAAQLPLQTDGLLLQVSASIGVTLFPDDDSDADSLLRHADQAMYRAKELGKNRYHLFDPATDRRLSAHREALQVLEAAFERRQFLLYYHPKIDIFSGEVVGAEALIRWRQEDGTIAPPAQFLPHMDGEALELAVSEWVIETALDHLAEFQAQGISVQVSANLVSRHLAEPRFLHWLRDLLAEYPGYITRSFSLEILESAAIGDIDAMAQQLGGVRAMGVELALDDFGTGYSSLAYFRRLPVDVLKIDQGFVRDMLDDASDHNIVESVVRLAEVFDRRAIAEGVETMEHWKALLALGCHYGQGYGIARPMPVENFVPWVRQWQQNSELKSFLAAAQSYRRRRQ
ncbi:MAG: EAL domain-containing protein [Rhodocyclaceae bacterium]|nr:EAL domain-containing protein [Rhodocyclaceae bacterium]